MTIKRFDKGPRMSQIVVHGDTVYLAGQTGKGADVTAQTQAILARVDDLLKQAGSDKSKLLQAIIWLDDMRDFAAMNAVWEKWIDPANPPARATGEVRLAAPECRVEITITAAL